MDALAHALAGIRLTSPLLAELKIGGDVELSLGGKGSLTGSSPFHYVSSGACRLLIGEDAFDLSQGDMIVLPHWPNYRLATGTRGSSFDILEVISEGRQPRWSPDAGLDTSLFLTLGEPPAVATLLSGIFVFEGSPGAFLLQALPALIHFRADRTGMGELLEASLAFVGGDAPGRPGYAATASRLLELLLVETLRTWALTTPHMPGLLRGMVDPSLARVIYAIHSRPGLPWSLEEMSRIAGRSRSSFARHFASIMGVTPAAYLLEWRCHLAERRLAESDVSVAALAEELGYGSSFAFSRAFRSLRKVTPAGYRRRKRMAAGRE